MWRGGLPWRGFVWLIYMTRRRIKVIFMSPVLLLPWGGVCGSRLMVVVF